MQYKRTAICIAFITAMRYGLCMSKDWVITRDKFLKREEIERLYKVTEDAKDLAIQRAKHLVYVRDYFILRALLETGLRVFELVGIQVQDFEGSAIIVQHGKNDKKRSILLTKGTQRLFRDFIKLKRTVLKESILPGAPLFLSERRKAYTTRAIRKRVKHWFSRCGFNGRLSVHSCRHTYISHMMASGVDLTTIRDNAGHSSLAITSIYSHAVKDDLGELELYSSDFSRSGNSGKSSVKKPQSQSGTDHE
jgi:site-specific recombinase XerD